MSNYDISFRQEAIRLALSSSKPIRETARDLGIKESTLYNWISKEKQKATSPSDIGESNLVDELNKLRKENARLKEEREILKKAAKFFAKESK